MLEPTPTKVKASKAPAEATPIQLDNVPETLTAISNNSLQIIDNTVEAPVEEAPVEVEEVPLLGALVQFNYR